MALVETVLSMCCGAVLMLVSFWDTKKILCDGLFVKTASDKLWLSQKPFWDSFFLKSYFGHHWTSISQSIFSVWSWLTLVFFAFNEFFLVITFLSVFEEFLKTTWTPSYYEIICLTFTHWAYHWVLNTVIGVILGLEHHTTGVLLGLEHSGRRTRVP